MDRDLRIYFLEEGGEENVILRKQDTDLEKKFTETVETDSISLKVKASRQQDG